ncbi:MAG: serine/threonine-protein kinase [Myxococcales bacterium]
MLGKTIDGKYQIVRLLGQGGMGAVYEAAHTGTGRRVALKLIIAETISRDAILRFQREARAAGVIESQHIVQVLDTGIDREQGLPFMVMEYLVGEDLQHLCGRIGALSPELALRIATQACSGIQKAHEARVIHRDIKPANIYLASRDEDVVVKLLDFGIAKVKEEHLPGSTDQALTRTGSMMGSPLYMSPEQAMGLKTIDHRTDLWSLGAVLYEVLAGKPPHHGAETLGQLILAICSAPPVPIQRLAPSVPDELAEIVHRAMRLDPNERFQSAADMRDAMRRLLPQGASLTQSMLVPDAAVPSTANLEPRAAATDGAVAGNTGEPLTRTAHRAPAGKAPLLLAGLALGAALGGSGLWLALRSPSGVQAGLDSATALGSPPSAAASLQANPARAEASPSATAAPAATASTAGSRPVNAARPSDEHATSASRAPTPSPRAPAASSAATAAAATATPKTPAAKSTGLTVDRNFE